MYSTLPSYNDRVKSDVHLIVADTLYRHLILFVTKILYETQGPAVSVLRLTSSLFLILVSYLTPIYKWKLCYSHYTYVSCVYPITDRYVNRRLNVQKWPAHVGLGVT